MAMCTCSGQHVRLALARSHWVHVQTDGAPFENGQLYHLSYYTVSLSCAIPIERCPMLARSVQQLSRLGLLRAFVRDTLRPFILPHTTEFYRNYLPQSASVERPFLFRLCI